MQLQDDFIERKISPTITVRWYPASEALEVLLPSGTREASLAAVTRDEYEKVFEFHREMVANKGPKAIATIEAKP